ncbi:MAG: homoserine kinase [Planctomycetes bacterium]|nr:homoserine kinase [Planctomycetota bacterium]
MTEVRDELQVFAPATVANLGPGFDVLGLALEGHGDRVTARLLTGERPGVRIVDVRGADLPLDPDRNTAGVAAQETLRAADVSVAIELELDKGLPIGSGLGSSAASAAAAAWAVNLLLGAPLRKVQLIDPCVAAEGVVAGRHADNVAPALLGGLILVRNIDPLDLVRLPVPPGLLLVAATPAFELPTQRAREALPREVPLVSMVRNSANLAAFVSACYSGDLGLLSRSLDDAVAAPARAALVPGAAAAIVAANGAGALGASISGAGPTVFALCHSRVTATRVAQAMVDAFAAAGLDAEPLVSPADCPGARRL